jgi:hypothetical protein
MWIYATYNRPVQFKECLMRLTQVGCSTPGIILIQGTDTLIEYQQAWEEIKRVTPEGNNLKNWEFVILPTNLGYCGGLNEAFKLHPNEPWYGNITDDERVHSPGWDVKIPEAAGSWYVAHGNDHWQSEVRIHGLITWGGDLVRLCGGLAPPGMWHWWIDNYWETIAAECGLNKFVRDIMVEDKHYLSGKSEYDETYKMGESRKDEDKAVFDAWLAQARPLIEKIKASMPRKTFDFTRYLQQS